MKKWAGKRVELSGTTNFTGKQGVITKIDFDTSNKDAFFGYEINIKLDNGKNVTAYKFDGINLLTTNNNTNI